MKIVAIIATCNRPELLKSRALASIANQTITPDYLVVCDDSEPENKVINRSVVDSISLSGCSVFYLQNHRSNGASGCWNSAVDLVLREFENSPDIVLAFLDDDDSWSPDYLETCQNVMTSSQQDMVAAGIQRIEGKPNTPVSSFAPEKLEPDLFLIGNPGIQGSNLFLKLNLFLKAGCFDESLSSATDRDLCIRIADLGGIRYSAVPRILVQHYAEPYRPRLSTKGSDEKLNGLTSFWQKYSGRMTQSQQLQFYQRANSLFDWQRPSINNETLTPQPVQPPVVLGISLGVENSSLQTLVNKLIEFRNKQLIGLDIVFLGENHVSNDSVQNSIQTLRENGLGCFLLDRFSSDFFEDYSDLDALSYCCLQISEARPGSETWLLEVSDASQPPDEFNTISALFQRYGAKKIYQSSLPSKIADSPESNLLEFRQRIHQQRIESAKYRVSSYFSAGELTLLGCGSEAVVFTDQKTIFKCIDYWKTRIPEAQLNFLKSQGGTWGDTPGLYALESVLADGPWILITYPYEKSVPYKGGHENDLIRFMDGCSRAGIVCNNVHPKNLVMTESGVKLIDYGSDIRPWSLLGFEHMARRAFLACYHADHRDLKRLMCQALVTSELPEMKGYPEFRQKLDFPFDAIRYPAKFDIVEPCHKFVLIVGIISSEPDVLLPLLQSLVHLKACNSIASLKVLLLDNYCPTASLESVTHQLQSKNMDLAVITPSQFEADAHAGLFGSNLKIRLGTQQSIAVSRTMIQRYMGLEMNKNPGAISWLLDDDMRVDARALQYLPWLPAFRDNGVDVLLGAYEGASPNPPLNGLRVQLMDIVHNLQWLNKLPQNIALPNRAAENENTREQFPDYYYDLSRKHSAHLENPMWLEPVYDHETVAEARARLIAGATGILNGDPLTRGIVARLCKNPIIEAAESVNRGGCTFVLNPDALNLTPNTILQIEGRDARRSDMIWAVVNRHYRGMNIKAVSFPVQHIGRINVTPSVNADKVLAEVVGSALYAGLTSFLKEHSNHRLRFTDLEIEQICELSTASMSQRLELLKISMMRIQGLTETLHHIDTSNELSELHQYLKDDFSTENILTIISWARKLSKADIQTFLAHLTLEADDYAAGLNLQTTNI
ncbi:glycosyltransferase family A protein [Oceanobacter sp. 1_MG-2023]|uniref:glycosyltransferase family 2 protein n=1 Tax=Oceanobacter sp. 2_MG-2023 TaxID=3062619 RepID=UPI00273273AE|nr:glycosyltransferase family A protein [Oceanobacter sp. 2_MG-2023]MDP2609631.1 glycosyltransferase family A protein [Oceanobacter sp. 1_MG-2023]